MLKAILAGKAGRIAVDGTAGEQSWKEVFRKREDLLTAVFFSRLRYLSQDGEQKILAMLIGSDLAQTLGDIQEVRFWPRLKRADGRRYVEPDLLLLFKDSLLMIEVKPPFGGDQTEGQWLDQVESLVQQRGLKDPEVDVPAGFHFLALGQNTPGSEQSAADLREKYSDQGLKSVHRHEWEHVCQNVKDFADNESGRDLHVYKDWLAAFELFGLVESPRPFEELLQLSREPISDWHSAMNKFQIPEPRLPVSSIDWKALADYAKNKKLKVSTWP
jgi:hypothetical protein